MREAFLQQVRAAVRTGNRAGAAPPLPERGGVGYQGAGPDLVARFCAELTAAGGRPHVAAGPDAAWQVIADIIQMHGCRNVLVGCGGLVQRLDVAGRLRTAGLAVTPIDALPPTPRDGFFAADLGISNVHRLIAETGTVVVATAPDEPRSLSLLPPIHIALAEPGQLLPDLFDLFDLFSPLNLPPACLSLITGPSKTGDIELRLVTGVHGPGEIHVIVCI
jgi:L-lactate dehydrogenase complex protein LldG